MKTTTFSLVFIFLLFNSVFGQKTLTLQPGPSDGKDTYLNSAFPDYQWGTNPNLVPCAWTYEGVFGAGRGLIRFDLSEIPPDAVILDARLTLFYDPDAAYGQQYGENASVIQKVTEAWDEMTATWNLQPACSGAGMITLPKTLTLTEDLTEIDITSFVDNWVADPQNNFGLLHRMAVEQTYCCLCYSSSDHSNPAKRPKLVVHYRDCTTPHAGFSAAIQIPVVVFTDTSSSASSWFWDFGDGYFSNLQHPAHTYSTPGIYTVCLTIADSCGSDTVCREIQVCEMPAPNYTYTMNGQMVNFRDSSVQALAWFWDFGDGFYSDLEDPQHYFNEPGTYYVCECVTNPCHVETFCDSVTVTVSGTGDFTRYDQLLLYPNPARNRVSLQMIPSGGSPGTLSLWTVQGTLTRQWIPIPDPGKGQITLDIGGIPQGIYILETKFGGLIRLNKLIIL